MPRQIVPMPKATTTPMLVAVDVHMMMKCGSLH
jgi:hypothetical protein